MMSVSAARAGAFPIRRLVAAAHAFLAMVCGVSGAAAQGATIPADSGSQADLQAAIDLAQPGDTVTIPAGTFDFSGQVSAPDGIHIEGAGRDQTILVKQDETSLAMIVIDCSGGEPFSFSGVTLQGKGRSLQGTDTVDPQTDVHDRGLMLQGRCIDFQVRDSRFTMFTRAGLVLNGSTGTLEGHATGVAYQNEFIDNFIPGLGYGVEVYGNAEWDSLELGTAEAVFVEDNLFDKCRHAIAANNGARYVFRHNTISNNYYPWASIDAHGLSSWPRGTRSYEIYENTLAFTPFSQSAWAIGIRGGDGVVFGNTFDHEQADSFFLLTIDSYVDGAPYPLPDQTTDLWLWDNVDNGVPVTHLRRGWNATMEADLAPYLEEGRDYHFQTKPGYTPYSYPHPDRQGVGGIGGSAGAGGSGGATGGTGGGTGGSSGSSGSPGTGGTPSTTGGAGGTVPAAAASPQDDGGCSCRTIGGASSPKLPALLSLIAWTRRA